MHHSTRSIAQIYQISAYRFLKFDEEVGFLILAFGSLNMSAMMAAICNIMYIYLIICRNQIALA